MLKLAVLGATGFLGSHLVAALAQQNDVEVFGMIHHRPPVNPPEDGKDRIHWVQGDLLDSDSLCHLIHGCDGVFHTASLCEVVHGWEPYRKINIEGTKNVIEACRREKIKALLYTSTPSVVSTDRNILNGTEDLPIPAHFIAPYPATKAVAEKLILEANQKRNREGLRTSALRPHLIWGDDDPHILPRIRMAAKSRRLRIIGNGKNHVSITHIDSAVRAHLLAMQELLSSKHKNAGEAYFIADQNVELWPWINQYLKSQGLPQITRKIPKWIAYSAAMLCEGVSAILPIMGAPKITRFLVQQLSQSHTFSWEKAHRDFNY